MTKETSERGLDRDESHSQLVSDCCQPAMLVSIEAPL